MGSFYQKYFFTKKCQELSRTQLSCFIVWPGIIDIEETSISMPGIDHVGGPVSLTHYIVLFCQIPRSDTETGTEQTGSSII